MIVHATRFSKAVAVNRNHSNDYEERTDQAAGESLDGSCTGTQVLLMWALPKAMMVRPAKTSRMAPNTDR